MHLQELKQIQLTRQHITQPADRLTVVSDLCGVQAQFMSNALHSLKIRCTDFDVNTVGADLCKNWTVRGTVHVFAQGDLSLFIGGKNYRKNDWTEPSFWNRQGALTPERQKYLSSIIIDAVEKQPCTREELRELCRTSGMTDGEEACMFNPWGGGIRQLCERGFLNYAVSEEKVFCAAPRFEPLDENLARLEIFRRYLTHMAPATLPDICYYFKCTRKEARTGLNRLPVKTVTVDGREYFYLGNLEEKGPEIPSCIFLAGFDQLMLAYEKQKSIYLPPEYLRGIFNLAGIVMPAVLMNGTVCGRWKKTKSKLEVFCFRELTGAEKKAVKSAAEVLWGAEINKLEVNI